MTNVGTYFVKNPSTRFVVLNTSGQHGNSKTVRIFNYPVRDGDVRDLLAIPGISEADIRHSLLKGDLLVKCREGELRVVASDIDLLQFNAPQLAFLQSIGITDGLQISGSGISFDFLQDVELVGTKNGINSIFTTPDKFLYSSDKKITVYLNGVRQTITENFLVSEGSGPGTGYDTVVMIEPPTALDALVADYFKDE